VSQRTEWRRFVEQRRPELHDKYPCAMPTGRRRCPRHATRIPPLTGLCKPCRDELYQQLALDYLAASERREPEGENTMNTDIEIVEGETTADTPMAPITLFGTSDPRVALERMADVATALVDVIDTKKLYAGISGKKHITVEGWTTLGGMLGVVPVVTGTRPNDTGDGIVATVEARTLDGRVVGAAEGECSRAESKWKNRDPFAIRSMAQTRAISRALRAPLGQIIVLAGYEATPAEEMPADEEPPRQRSSPAAPVAAKPEQYAEIWRLIERLTELRPGVDWKERARKLAGAPADMLTVTTAQMLLDGLAAKLPTAEEFQGE
jgi:hypothetical protein